MQVLHTEQVGIAIAARQCNTCPVYRSIDLNNEGAAHLQPIKW